MEFKKSQFSAEFASELTKLSSSFQEIAESLINLKGTLEEKNQEIQNLLDFLPVPISVVEQPNKEVFYLNKTALDVVGEENAQDLLAGNFNVYISATGEICPPEKTPLARSLQGETVYDDSLELRIGEKREKILPVEVWTKPIFDSNHNIIFAISIFQNISERKKAEKVLAETVIKQTELDKAKKIQTSLYPKWSPLLPNFELAYFCQPSMAVGGDLYDYYFNDQKEFIFTLADVMGKGMSAALLAASFRSCLRISSLKFSPSQALISTAKAMEDDLEKSESFVTCVHCHLDPSNRLLSYVNAGHGHGFMLGKNGGIEKLPKGNPPVSPMLFALFDDTKNNFKEHQHYFQPQDTLVLYSDGLTDCKPELDLSPEKIADLIKDFSSAREIINYLSDLVATEEDSVDDLTILVLRCVS